MSTSTEPTPTGEPQPPSGEPQPTISEPQTLTGEPQPPTSELQHLTGEPQPPTSELQPLIGEPQPPTSEPQPLTGEPQPPTGEPQPHTTASYAIHRMVSLCCGDEPAPAQQTQGGVVHRYTLLRNEPRSPRTLIDVASDSSNSASHSPVTPRRSLLRQLLSRIGVSTDVQPPPAAPADPVDPADTAPTAVYYLTADEYEKLISCEERIARVHEDIARLEERADQMLTGFETQLGYFGGLLGTTAGVAAMISSSDKAWTAMAYVCACMLLGIVISALLLVTKFRSIIRYQKVVSLRHTTASCIADMFFTGLDLLKDGNAAGSLIRVPTIQVDQLKDTSYKCPSFSKVYIGVIALVGLLACLRAAVLLFAGVHTSKVLVQLIMAP